MCFDTILNFVANILSGIIGGLFTYFGVKITIKNNKNKDDFEKKKIKISKMEQSNTL